MKVAYAVMGVAALAVTSASLDLRGSPAAARIVRGPYLQPGESSRGINVVWYTDIPSAGAVLQYREQFGSWRDIAVGGPPALRHEVTIPSLQEGFPYDYRILGEGVPLFDLVARSQFRFDAPQSMTLKFAAFADSGIGNANQIAVARGVFQEVPLPNFVLVAGDVVYPNGADADYDRKFFAPYASLLPRMPFYAAIGNHDYETLQGAPYLNVFSLRQNGPPELVPETVYSFEQAGVHFTVHDSNLPLSRLRTFAGPWHIADVRASDAPFRIVSMHHSPYSSAQNSLRPPTPTVRNFFTPLLAETGVDLVIAGHDHVYERSHPLGGVVYVTTGAGGHELYARASTNDYTRVFYGLGGRHSYSMVEVSGRILSLRQTDIAGCLVDTFALHKPLAEGDSWRILRGTSEPPPAWYLPEFRDETWTAVRGAFGYGNPDIKTPITDMQGAYLTLYARATFEASTTNVNNLMLRIRYDDGFVAYLNGREVARRNLAQGQSFRTQALVRHSGEWYETVHLDPSALRPGRNVLAIEGHNVSLANDSFLLGPELTLMADAPGHCP